MFQKFSKQILNLVDVSDSTKLLRTINAIQSNIETFVNSIVSKIQLDSTELTNINLKQGLNIINHTLARPIKGYYISRTNNQVDIWDDNANTSPNLTIWLYASATANVSLIVY